MNFEWVSEWIQTCFTTFCRSNGVKNIHLYGVVACKGNCFLWKIWVFWRSFNYELIATIWCSLIILVVFLFFSKKWLTLCHNQIIEVFEEILKNKFLSLKNVWDSRSLFLLWIAVILNLYGKLIKHLYSELLYEYCLLWIYKLKITVFSFL